MKTKVNYDEMLGTKKGRLTLVKVTGERNARREMLGEFECECGGKWSGPIVRWKSGNTKSCGCLHPEVVADVGKYTTKHGDCTSPTYKAHRSMMRRCYDEKNISYPHYGGRGITVCERWRGVENYPNFKADMGERPPGTTLDRYPDGNGNYEPGNCRWATPSEQGRNLSTNRWITVDGETLVMTDWANRLGVTPTTILDRLKRGWSEKDAVSIPPDRSNQGLLHKLDGEVLTTKELAERFGLSERLILSRMAKGLSLVEAVSTKSLNTLGRNVPLIIDGVSKTIREWSKVSGIRYETIHARVKAGWTSKDAVFKAKQEKTTKR